MLEKGSSYNSSFAVISQALLFAHKQKNKKTMKIKQFQK